ncbi:hypothetical protein P43SY_010590 [Pythium insidiosum]|uniref:Uncharacterized protein n=1 Tax=Pythium insidiosum TaxID=114742 RepID=A0AAD5L8H6_PYTIN|nr:hypothetical protein P43SY_010590 [Pythium insidiosum]
MDGARGHDAHDDGDAPLEHESAGKSSVRRRLRPGFSIRKRIGLKIDADDAKGDASHASPSREDGAARSEDVEWWKKEYRAPPPGHLGAHVVTVDDKADAGSTSATDTPRRHRAVRRNSMESTERKLEMMDVAAVPSSQYETPERPQRRARGAGGDYHDARIAPDSSPNQKRKIIDLQDADATVFAPTVVAKEPKRFHEPSSSQHATNSSSSNDGGAAAADAAPTAITPSNLLRPMTKIDIQAGASASLSRSSDAVVPESCTKSA